MSLWSRAQQLPPESLQQVRAVYGEHFPIEVRHCLASWIETKIWTPEPEEQQRYFVEELVQEITTHAELMLSPDMFVTKMKLLEAAKQFRMQYSHAPHELYTYMRRCLALETEIIQNAMWTSYIQPEMERKYSEFITGLQTVRQKVNMAAEEIRGLQANIESFSLQYHECLKNKGHINYLQQSGPLTPENQELAAYLRVQIEEMEMKLNTLITQINQSQMELVDHMKVNINNLRQLQSQVLDEELIRWKREQQLSGNGVPMQSNLNMIQEWCEMLADLIWSTRQQVVHVACINDKTLAELRQPHLADMLDDMSKQVTSLLSTLVTSTFVIEKQPPQVMKTNIRFTATVRLLVGGQLNVHMTPPKVTVAIISEQQAQQLLKSDSVSGPSKAPAECGDILNNSDCMEYQPTSRQLSVSFRNMQVRKIKRAQKKVTESVTDEKFTLLFRSEFSVGGGELVFQVWTLSLPVVVIVHGNQEPHGWATITWDNAFSSSGRLPFAVPDKVSWGQLAETLRIKFWSATGGDLSEDNLRFLAEKIFSLSHRSSLTVSNMELNSMTVSWIQFGKDALPERNFTFWEWFYMVVKLTRDYLSPLWCDRLIMGFIQKKQAEEMLSKCPPGTFLLRFSDSELGGITIAWVGEGNEVFSLQPFTSRDLMLRSLADRILDLAQLQFLYPNVAKDDVFSKYYTKPENEMLKNGYVKPVLVTTLPPYMSSSPAYAHSPDSHRNTPSVHSHSSYFSAATSAQTENSFMDSELFEQIRAFSFDDIDKYGGNATMK
ncbi:signal transducer and activator of transcription 5B-like [Melitaea cinxia]|uniref:signal transducer and activator of transcription 5B-like n=1 Tax=Melitaea cinxia TaxID=113334 RepID=UPI001E271493|nr:signal transducer and activator of transcription 5B-like [Melitaea cinxia]